MKKQRETLRQTLKEKECTHCGNIKPIDDFAIKNDTKDGRQPYCRKCAYEVKKAWKQQKKKLD
jgi:NAD-dependent SIR2 family protein deacetylase